MTKGVCKVNGWAEFIKVSDKRDKLCSGASEKAKCIVNIPLVIAEDVEETRV
jgi:hypothetical protein